MPILLVDPRAAWYNDYWEDNMAIDLAFYRREGFATDPESVARRLAYWRARHPHVPEARARRRQLIEEIEAWRRIHRQPIDPTPQVVAPHRTRRRSRKHGIKRAAHPRVIEEKRLEYAGICPYCGARIDGVDGIRSGGHIDHVVPHSHGGTNQCDNLAYVCHACNLAKGTKPLLVFLLERLA